MSEGWPRDEDIYISPQHREPMLFRVNNYSEATMDPCSGANEPAQSLIYPKVKKSRSG